MNEIFDRMRASWEGLNDREQRLVGALGFVAVLVLLGFPLLYTASQNATMGEENDALRSALTLLAEHHAELQLLTETRRSSLTRYQNKTPPLGSFLEGEAQKQGLTIREVTDQPEKAFGIYHRRGVSASINEAGLTGIMNLLSALASSTYPIAVDLIQIEHYQSGDSYRLKLGVLTFDRTSPASNDTNESRRPKLSGG